MFLLFALPGQTLRLIRPLGERCAFAENDPLFSAGDYPFNSYVILSGPPGDCCSSATGPIQCVLPIMNICRLLYPAMIERTGFCPDHHDEIRYPIVDCVSDSLLAAEIFLSRLHRNVSKQELDLLQFTASDVAEART
jgi:hypothetical protein